MVFSPLGKLLAVATIPISLIVFLWRLMPGACRRYTLTNRRLIVQLGLTAKDGPSIGLDGFDSIEVAVLPGQDFLHAGDLVFNRDGKEVFRLRGVSARRLSPRLSESPQCVVRGREVCQQQAAVAAPSA